MDGVEANKVQIENMTLLRGNQLERMTLRQDISKELPEETLDEFDEFDRSSEECFFLSR